jgi:hypothetical protein
MRDSKDLNEKDLVQILMAYSKSQNLSNEFAYVLEQKTIEHFSKF